MADTNLCLDRLTAEELNLLLTGVCSALEHKDKKHAWDRKWKIPQRALEQATPLVGVQSGE